MPGPPELAQSAPDLPVAPGGPPQAEEPQPRPASVAWERRTEVGFFSAIVETTQDVLLHPARFFSAVDGSRGIGAPLLYGLIVGYVGVVVGSLYAYVYQSVTGATVFPGFHDRPELERLLPLATGSGALVTNLVVGPVFLVIRTFLLAGVFHVCLLLVGGARRGFETTFAVVAYGAAADLLVVIPLCGGIAGTVYGFVLAAIGLTAAHRTTAGRGAAAVSIPLLGLCCCCLLLLIAFWGTLATIIRSV